MNVMTKRLSTLFLVCLVTSACKTNQASPTAAAPTDLNAGTVAEDVQKEAKDFIEAMDTANSTDLPFDTAIAAVATVSADDPKNPLNQPNADLLVATGAVAGQKEVNKAQAVAVLNGEAPCSLLAPVKAAPLNSKQAALAGNQKPAVETQQAELLPVQCKPTADQGKVAKQNAFIATLVIGGIALAGAVALYAGRDLYFWFGADPEARKNSKVDLAKLEVEYRELIPLNDPARSFQQAVRTIASSMELPNGDPAMAVLDDLLDENKRDNLTKEQIEVLDEGLSEAQKRTFMDSYRNSINARAIYHLPNLGPEVFAEYLKNLSAPGADANKASLVPEILRQYLGIEADVNLSRDQKFSINYLATISKLSISPIEVEIASKVLTPKPLPVGTPLHPDTTKVEVLLAADGMIEPAKRQVFAHYLASTNFLSSFPQGFDVTTASALSRELASNIVRQVVSKNLPLMIENADIGQNSKESLLKLANLPDADKAILLAELEGVVKVADRRKIFSETLRMSPADLPTQLVALDLSPDVRLREVAKVPLGVTEGILTSLFKQTEKVRTEAITKAKMFALTEMPQGPAREAILASLAPADRNRYVAITEALGKAPTTEKIAEAQKKMKSYDRKINRASGALGAIGAVFVVSAIGIGASTFSANLALAGKKGNKYKGKPYAEQRKLLHQALGQICVKHNLCNASPAGQ